MRTIKMPDDGDAPKNAISSMVDISFLLLIFFLVATTIQPTERDLPLKFPSPGVKSVVVGDPVRVTIEEDGWVRWGEGVGEMLVATSDENGPLEKLHEMLEVSVAAWGKGQPGVMLKVADDVAQQRFVDVLDAFAACGIETVGFTD